MVARATIEALLRPNCTIYPTPCPNQISLSYALKKLAIRCLHRLVENEEVSVYCDANVDISHVAPRGTESDANCLATSFPHGWARRNKQGHTKDVEFLLDEHKKSLSNFL
jgi:hypothetical protein